MLRRFYGQARCEMINRNGCGNSVERIGVTCQRLRGTALKQFHLRRTSDVRIPTHPVGCSDNIRSAIPEYPVT
jgi:hypothetical protein